MMLEDVLRYKVIVHLVTAKHIKSFLNQERNAYSNYASLGITAIKIISQ